MACYEHSWDIKFVLEVPMERANPIVNIVMTYNINMYLCISSAWFSILSYWHVYYCMWCFTFMFKLIRVHYIIVPRARLYLLSHWLTNFVFSTYKTLFYTYKISLFYKRTDTRRWQRDGGRVWWVSLSSCWRVWFRWGAFLGDRLP
jgi:hypothetical protein